MSLWKLTLAYDGTPYHGWQVQPGLATVQGTLSDAICQVTRERVLPQGSGRTDTGVHALGQVASFVLKAAIPPPNFQRALNRTLPPSIRVLAAEHAEPPFHARHSAVAKTYEYRIFPLHPERICPPTIAPYVWACPWPLDLILLNEAAAQVTGTHDFTSFAASDPDLATRSADAETGSDGVGLRSMEYWGAGKTGVVDLPVEVSVGKTPIRTIRRSLWLADGELVIYTVTGSGFLHHMVRNLVGTFVQCGAARLDPMSIHALLAARNRSLAGPTAPASGLFLVDVSYLQAQANTGEQAGL